MTFGHLGGSRLTIGMALLFIALPSAAQQETHGHEADGGHHQYAVAGFIGSTRAHGENEFTLGVEFGYHLNSRWSIGAVFERAERERHTSLLLAGVGWHPFGPALRFQLAAGIKDPSGTTEAVLRTGVGYEMELDNGWFIKPYLAADFISNEDTEGVFGLYIGRGF